jgi:hypothetical protein
MRQYDPRTIAFISELIHFPVQHDVADLRRVYSRLGEINSGWYINFNADPAQGSGQLVTMRPATPQAQVSAVTMMPDRIQVQEEMTDLTLEEFLERLDAVAATCVDELGVQQFNLQQCVVRSVVTPRTTQDARIFLGERLCGLGGEQLGDMGRPVGMLGLRFMFPATETDNSVYNVRIESYNFDVRSIFLEVAAVFPSTITRDRHELLAENFHAAYGFMQNNLCGFVARFDTEEA